MGMVEVWEIQVQRGDAESAEESAEKSTAPGTRRGRRGARDGVVGLTEVQGICTVIGESESGALPRIKKCFPSGVGA